MMRNGRILIYLKGESIGLADELGARYKRKWSQRCHEGFWPEQLVRCSYQLRRGRIWRGLGVRLGVQLWTS